MAITACVARHWRTAKVVTLLLYAAMTNTGRTAAATARHSYAVDTAASGPRFDGVGAISGGGGETVLLPAYPATARAEILDFLFRPAFGAALHLLKVEIGGDALSTDGAEPSHMHTEADLPDFARGYEFWVAAEAKRRNPAVLLYGLPWEWPAWVGEGTGSPWANISKPVHYTMQWLKGARAVHSLDIDFIGLVFKNATAGAATAATAPVYS